MILEERLANRMKELIQEKRRRLQVDSARLEGLSPLKKLSQGYAYVSTEAGKTLDSVDMVKPGEQIEVYVLDGNISAKVVSTAKVKRGES